MKLRFLGPNVKNVMSRLSERLTEGRIYEVAEEVLPRPSRMVMLKSITDDRGKRITLSENAINKFFEKV